nr:Ig-like domain-containing protein [Jiangella mangrovi]
MNRSEYAAVAGLAVSQFVDTFDQPQNAYARAALRFAPLLLLTPQRRGRGLESFVADPRVIGGAAILGITVLGEQRNRASIDVAAPSQLAAKSSVQLNAQVISPRGDVVSGRAVQWTTSDPNIATVDATGKVTGVNAGAVFLIATSEGLPARRIPLVVT